MKASKRTRPTTRTPSAKAAAMTVAEAGRKGGQATRDKYGHDFYEQIGRKGGRKVRDLIAAGKKAMEE